MRSNRNDQADALLQEWAGRRAAVEGCGYPAMNTEPTVSGGKASETSPERYTRLLERHARTNRVVESIRHSHGHLWLLLWREYVTPSRKENGQLDTRRMAEQEGVAERTWRKRRKNALELFLQRYESIISN